MSVRFQADGAKFVVITCPPFQAVGIYLHKQIIIPLSFGLSVG